MGADSATPVVHVVEVGAGPDVDADPWNDYVQAWLPLQARLFRVALLIARDRAEAEDAVSEVMAATYRPWQAGRVESLPVYARRAVVNRLTGRHRRRVVADRHLHMRSGDDRGAIGLDDDVTERMRVRRALLELAPRQRAIVALRYYAELSVEETARALGCAEGTVKSQAHDALARLRSLLGRGEDG